MHKGILQKAKVLLLFLIFIFALTGCQKETPVLSENTQSKGGFIKLASGAYDCADTAIVMKKLEKENKITFFNLVKKKNYTLEYDGTTECKDKYGSPISISQLSEGEMVEINFLKENKHIVKIEASSKIWTYDDVTKYELDANKGKIKLFDEIYNIDEDTVLLSGDTPITLMDINPRDALCIKGIDHKIYSIVVEKGHGYLRLLNEEYFIGGWIEVGQKLIQKVEEDMLLVVPEGTYQVYLSHSGIQGSKEVVIKRNKETQLDVGDLKKDDLIKYGDLIFTIEPTSAKVFIDGKAIDSSKVVKTEYGLHQIMVREVGYETVVQYIRVNENSANIAITLDEEKDRSVSENSVSKDNNSSIGESAKETETVSGNETIGNSATQTETGSTTGYKVSITSPEDAEVYVDGNYVGIIPASFPKTAGSHEITIRKSGYKTRSYTIKLDDEKKDANFSFSDLTKED